MTVSTARYEIHNHDRIVSPNENVGTRSITVSSLAGEEPKCKEFLGYCQSLRTRGIYGPIVLPVGSPCNYYMRQQIRQILFGSCISQGSILFEVEAFGRMPYKLRGTYKKVLLKMAIVRFDY